MDEVRALLARTSSLVLIRRRVGRGKRMLYRLIVGLL